VTQPVTISATGDHLKAKLEIDESGLLGSLKDLVSTPLAVTAYTGLVPVTFSLSNMTGAEAATITSVKVDVVFPSTVGDTLGSDGQGGALELGNLKVKLTQIP
jgi:alternate signal-mediated exported protein